MSDYLIRPLRERDIESIIAIDALLTGGRGPDRAGFWRGLLSIGAVLDERQEPPAEGPDARPPVPHLCDVAETKAGPGGVVGFIIGDVQSWQFGIPRHGRIVAIGVHPDHRRREVATMLADSLLNAFRKMGLSSVLCLVGPGDTLGDFFQSVGFRGSDFRVLEKTL